MIENKLEQELAKIDEQMNALGERRGEIISQIRDQSVKVALEEFNSWGISAGSCVVLFPKTSGAYHWEIVGGFKVEAVDQDKRRLDVIYTTYHESDYEFWVKTDRDHISFDSLAGYKEDCNIYIVDEVQFVLMQQHLNKLTITAENYKDYEAVIAQHADARILS